MIQPIHTICVCGAGTMGSGIAQVAAQNHFHVILFDVDQKILRAAEIAIKRNLSFLSQKNKISVEEEAAIFKSIRFVSDTNDCISDIVIEAIIEKAEAKIALFNQLAEINHSETIFATNTSSLSVSGIGQKVRNPSRVAGMHFFNPPQVMKLVEVVKAENTNDETIHSIYELAKQLGKVPVLCKDVPGFIVNRVARHYYLESLKLAEQGHADFETIDRLLEASGFKMGPFRLMDLIGNDINLAVTQSLYEAFEKPLRFRPSVLQAQKVKEGDLGRKTGKGYYNYEK